MLAFPRYNRILYARGPRLNPNVGLTGHLVAPHRPAGAGAAGEQFKPWPRTHGFNQRERLFRLLAVPLRQAGCEDVWGVSPRRKPTCLAVAEEDGLRPVDEVVAQSRRLDPVDRCEVAEPPRPQDGEPVLQKGVGRPQPQVGVWLRHVAHGQRFDLINRHGRVRQALCAILSALQVLPCHRLLPRRVGDDAPEPGKANKRVEAIAIRCAHVKASLSAFNDPK